MSRRHLPRRRPLAVLAALAMLAGLLALGSSPAGAVPVGDATLEGTVTTSDGTSIATTLTLCVPSYGPFCDGYSSTTSNPDGTYQFAGIAGGSYRLSALVPVGLDGSYQLSTTMDVAVAPTGATTQDLALGLGGKVSGTVTTPQGDGVTTNVSLRSEPASPFGPSDFAQSDGEAGGSYTSWRALPAGTATVTVHAPSGSGLWDTTVTGVPIVAGETTSGVNLVLDAGGTISGTVSGPSGPVVGATVTYTTATCSGPCTTTTGPDGSYSLPAPTSSGTLSVTPPTSTLLPTSGIAVAVGTGLTTTRNITLQAAPTSASVSMSVTFVGGTPGMFSVATVCPYPSVPNSVYVGAPGTQCVNPDTTTVANLGTLGATFGPAPRLTTTSSVPVPSRVNVAASEVVTFTSGAAVPSSPVATLDLAANDIVTCNAVIDLSGGTGGSISCAGAKGVPPGGDNTATVPATGGGSATITSPDGTTLSAVSAVDTSGETLPPGAALPFGAFAFTLSGVAPGGSADVTITYPLAEPAPNGYVKRVGDSWVDATSDIVQDLGPGTVTIRLTDGGPWDSDGTANGVIVDPGGPAVLDQSAPTVSVTGVVDGATYTVGSVPTAGCTAADEEGGSGLGTPACTVEVTGGNALGVGTYTATARATDLAGNTATATATYSVRFATSGFEAPVDNLPTVNSGKARRAYPVKFALRTASGTPVTDLAAVTSLRYRSLSCGSTASTTEAPLEAEATGASGLRVTDGRFQFNWATPGTAGCYELQVGLADGTTLRAQFHLR